MVRLLTFLKVFTIATLLFLFLQTGSGRELILRSSKGGVVNFSTTPFQESRETMELADYDDTGPNTNKRSGFTRLPPSRDAPAPQG